MTKNKVPHCHDLCTDTISAYVWGADLSGAIHGAGGVGGLLAVKRDGAWYDPLYDANGNVTAYVSETGAVVAEYEYDAFGATVSQSGALSDAFRHRFSTKPWIAALGVYDYGERVYSPELRRWLSRDPIGEDGGVNLYAFCGNDAVNGVDYFGMWSATSESYGKRRRIYRKQKGDTEQGLAMQLGLNAGETEKWLKRLNGCEVSVPNVYIAADLLRGGGLWDRVINLGGTIGQFIGTDLLRYGYHLMKPKTMDDLVGNLIASWGDLYGLTIYAHGDENGRVDERRDRTGNYISRKNLQDAVRKNGYKPAVAWLMQCYSFYKPNGRKRGFKDEWNETVEKPGGYHGMNFLGIDLYYW